MCFRVHITLFADEHATQLEGKQSVIFLSRHSSCLLVLCPLVLEGFAASAGMRKTKLQFTKVNGRQMERCTHFKKHVR